MFGAMDWTAQRYKPGAGGLDDLAEHVLRFIPRTGDR
jgi:hypothetical protein